MCNIVFFLLFLPVDIIIFCSRCGGCDLSLSSHHESFCGCCCLFPALNSSCGVLSKIPSHSFGLSLINASIVSLGFILASTSWSPRPKFPKRHLPAEMWGHVGLYGADHRASVGRAPVGFERALRKCSLQVGRKVHELLLKPCVQMACMPNHFHT